MSSVKFIGKGVALRNVPCHDEDAPHFCGTITCRTGREVALGLWLSSDPDGNSCFYAELGEYPGGEGEPAETEIPDPDAYDPRLKRTPRRPARRGEPSRYTRLVRLYVHYRDMERLVMGKTTLDNLRDPECMRLLETYQLRARKYLLKISGRDPMPR